MRTVLALAVALLVLAPVVDAAARTVTARYVAGVDSFQFTVNALNLGGAQFAPRAGETLVNVTVVDDVAGPGVAVSICQHPVDDGTCGDEPGEPQTAGCTPLTLAIRDVGGPVGVWVGTVSSPVVGCTLLPPTRGEIRAVFE